MESPDVDSRKIDDRQLEKTNLRTNELDVVNISHIKSFLRCTIMNSIQVQNFQHLDFV